jgi:putative tricarboxylic transport membrane protein
MSEASHDSGRGPYQRQVEIGVAIGTALFGLLVMYGSMKVGVGWGVEGPKAGFFPFYVGLSIVLSSAVNLFRTFADTKPEWVFASWSQLRSVMSVVLPTAVYVGSLPYLRSRNGLDCKGLDFDRLKATTSACKTGGRLRGRVDA